MAIVEAPLWTPLPGPQTVALESEADELYYGGAAGGGKSDLLLGYGLTRARAGIVFRREYKQFLGPEALVERSKAIVGRPELFNNSQLVWRLSGGRQLEFGAVEHEDDRYKYMGRAHDFTAFDEIAQFPESVYLFLLAWARTTVPDQRVRVIACGNPPQHAEGQWVIRRWAPWLDASHADPAEPGELLWFAMLDHGDGLGARDTEVQGPEPFEWRGETVYPQSRTFIPASLDDNPYLSRGGYRARLQALPEPLRSQMLFGDHTIGLADDAFQVIPTAWVRAAQERWRADGRPTDKRGKPSPPTATGMDVAEGGGDRTVLARRYGTWFAELEVHPGRTVSATPDAKPNAALALKALSEGGSITIDADGLGASTYYLVRAQVGIRALAFRGSSPTKLVDRSGALTFANMRAFACWRMRDWLDPSSGYDVALPPGRELLAELCSARWTMQTNGVQLEPKERIKARLGRSPDLAEAVVCSTITMPDERPGMIEWSRG